MITKEAFEPFLAFSENAELVEQNKYGVLVYNTQTQTFEPTIIIEDDFAKYKHSENQPADIDIALEFHLGGHFAWPLVDLIEA